MYMYKCCPYVCANRFARRLLPNDQQITEALNYAISLVRKTDTYTHTIEHDARHRVGKEKEGGGGTEGVGVKKKKRKRTEKH